MNTANTQEALQENMNELAALVKEKTGADTNIEQLLVLAVAGSMGGGIDNTLVCSLIKYLKDNPAATMEDFTAKLFSLLPSPTGN